MTEIYTILPFVIITCLWIHGFHCIFAEGFLLEKAGDWMADQIPKWICDPLFECPMCMSSIHGTLIFFLFVGMPLQWWPLLCVSVCGLNFIINTLHVAISEKS